MAKSLDLGQKYTDKEVAKLDKEIRKVYKQSEKDINAKLKDFKAKHKVKDAKYRQMVKDGKMDKADYKAWKQGQVFQSKQWEQRKEQIASVLTHSDEAAHKLAQGRMQDVFTFNANFMSYKVENDKHINLGLPMYDSATVANLIKNNPKLLPEKKLNIPKDMRWNMKRINSQVTQSIIQGESIDDLVERLSKEMPNSSYKMARVHARTMMTSAQNAGRLESMKMHQKMGIKSIKVWIATLDERTRWMHRDLDGQEQEIDKPFEVGQYSIMYPADPNAAPAMVYNCRCSMAEDVKKYPSENHQRRDNINQEVIPYMTYNQWALMKGIANARPNGRVPAMPMPTEQAVQKRAEEYAQKLLATMAATEAAEVVKLIDDAPEDLRYMYETYTSECNKIVRTSDGGEYIPSLDKVDYSYELKHKQMNKYSTMAHEMGHMFDEKIGRTPVLNYGEADLINEKVVFGSGRFKVLKCTPSCSDEFLSAMRKDKIAIGELLKRDFFDDDLEIFRSDMRNDASSGVQDAIDGFYSRKKISSIRWGHGDKYYNRWYNNKVKTFGLEKDLQSAYTELGMDAKTLVKTKAIARDYETASELWANVSSAALCGGEELSMMEEYMPNSLKAYREIIGKVAKHGRSG